MRVKTAAAKSAVSYRSNRRRYWRIQNILKRGGLRNLGSSPTGSRSGATAEWLDHVTKKTVAWRSFIIICTTTVKNRQLCYTVWILHNAVGLLLSSRKRKPKWCAKTRPCQRPQRKQRSAGSWIRLDDWPRTRWIQPIPRKRKWNYTATAEAVASRPTGYCRHMRCIFEATSTGDKGQ